MRRRELGPGGPPVPVICQGTWSLDEVDRGRAIRSLRAGLDAGATHVDTAEMYGDGAAEELVGEALEGRRDEVFLVSKVLPENASRRGTVDACERSLRRLRTDRLDLYLLHWPGSHLLEDTVAAFRENLKTVELIVQRGSRRPATVPPAARRVSGCARSPHSIEIRIRASKCLHPSHRPLEMRDEKAPRDLERARG